jgi:cyclic nucleotide gated channel, plant
MGADVLSTKAAIIFIVITQYIPRFLRIFPLLTELKKSSGVSAESAMIGAVYYLVLYLIASHVSFPSDDLNFSILLVCDVIIS